MRGSLWVVVGVALAVGCTDGGGSGSSSSSSGGSSSGGSSGGGVDAGPPDAAMPADAAVPADAGGDPGDAGGGLPNSHSEDNGGAMHKPGKTDPLTNCVACHGADLTGGVGQSCYNCHNNDDHTIDRFGNMHKSGADSTCNACHGPNNTGGLGPACSQCH